MSHNFTHIKGHMSNRFRALCSFYSCRQLGYWEGQVARHAVVHYRMDLAASLRWGRAEKRPGNSCAHTHAHSPNCHRSCHFNGGRTLPCFAISRYIIHDLLSVLQDVVGIWLHQAQPQIPFLSFQPSMRLNTGDPRRIPVLTRHPLYDRPTSTLNRQTACSHATLPHLLFDAGQVDRS